ncbi:uncharacterized protein K460DRAFT_360895 [Cucurbitaria berberidis CBS 394.84]|uniref:Uncharacterized protein n=1 Tax=Cucurbitaria berberidis CBS 394.84 TaxID=1168544 RepID=A0A9P4GRM8_9PLEO|nr:uncharacterized protein K460DRAFT_360895 [Cucurbitaria berberidis CBS 394.84]KAF1850029.1 hypothetical protein K460DRAFT_360895 [Cucurbitaria berberidis CBS 394.84]
MTERTWMMRAPPSVRLPRRSLPAHSRTAANIRHYASHPPCVAQIFCVGISDWQLLIVRIVFFWSMQERGYADYHAFLLLLISVSLAYPFARICNIVFPIGSGIVTLHRILFFAGRRHGRSGVEVPILQLYSNFRGSIPGPL